MRTSIVITFVIGVSLAVSSVEAQLTPDQARQIAARVRSNPNLTVSADYSVVDLMVESVPAPDPLTHGPFAVIYSMGTDETITISETQPEVDAEEYSINYYTGDVWAFYNDWERQQWILPAGSQLTRDQCYAIALDFVRQRFPNFDQRNMVLVGEGANTVSGEKTGGGTYEEKKRIFVWYEVDPQSGARLLNACCAKVWDVSGAVTSYWEMQRTTQVSPLPTLTEQQAAAIVLDYLFVTYGAEGDTLELIPDEELSLDCKSGLWMYEDEFMTQRLVWRFPIPPFIGVDAHTGQVVFDEGLGGGGTGKEGRKIKKAPVPRKFAYRPLPYQRGKLVLLVKGWEREPLLVGPQMQVLRWRETAVWRRTELHGLSSPPLLRQGRHWLAVDYFKGFGAQVRWQGQQVEIVGKHGLRAKRTPRWIRGKSYLPVRVLEEVALARLWWDEKERVLVVRLEGREFNRTPHLLAQQPQP